MPEPDWSELRRFDCDYAGCEGYTDSVSIEQDENGQALHSFCYDEMMDPQ